MQELKQAVAALAGIPVERVPYSDVMGVPITFLDKYNPEQFEIVGATESEGRGFSRGLWVEDSRMAQATVRGRRVYKRLFIHPKTA